MRALNVQQGDKFGDRVIIAEAPRRKNLRTFLVRCVCGSEDVVTLGNLVAGMADRCRGCGQRKRERPVTMRPRRPWRRRAISKMVLRKMWADRGMLYSAHYDERERNAIREELRELGELGDARSLSYAAAVELGANISLMVDVGPREW